MEMSPFFCPEALWEEEKKTHQEKSRYIFWGVFSTHEVGVSKNRGTPKWMVKIMENLIKIDNLGAHPYFWKHPGLKSKLTFKNTVVLFAEPLNYVHARRKVSKRINLRITHYVVEQAIEPDFNSWLLGWL